jgi:hypothetical protein
LTPKEDCEQPIERDVDARVRAGVEALIEEIPEDGITEHLEVGSYELVPTYRHEYDRYYTPVTCHSGGRDGAPQVPRGGDNIKAVEELTHCTRKVSRKSLTVAVRGRRRFRGNNQTLV